MSQEQDRAAFEAWARDAITPQEWPMLMERRGNGYAMYTTQCAWIGWQAAIAHERARIKAALPPAGYVDAAEVRRVVEGER